MVEKIEVVKDKRVYDNSAKVLMLNSLTLCGMGLVFVIAALESIKNPSIVSIIIMIIGFYIARITLNRSIVLLKHIDMKLNNYNMEDDN